MKKKLFMLFVVMTTCFTLLIPNVYADRAPFLTSGKVQCGSDGAPLIQNIPSYIPNLTANIYNLVMVLVPALMVFLGVFDLIKAIMSQKEDEIKKGQQTLMKRVITGFSVFLVVMLVKVFVTIFLSNATNNKVIGCIDCFIDGADSCK